MPDWKKIKAEYIAGGTSYRKLAEKYCVSFSTLQKVGAEEKWTDLRKKSSRKAEEKIVESVANREARTAVSIDSVADALLEKITEGIADGTLTADAKTLKATTGALRDIKEIKGFKTDADMREQEARIEKLRREAKADMDNNVTFILGKDIEEYGV